MVEISKPELRARNMAINLFPGLYLSPNQAAIMAGTMATNAHHVVSDKVPVGLITGMVALIEAAEKVSNNACTDHRSRFCWVLAVFLQNNFLLTKKFPIVLIC